MTEASEEQIVALRDRIRAAGRDSAGSRTKVVWGIFLPALALLLGWFWVGSQYDSEPASLGERLAPILVVAGFLFAYSAVIALVAVRSQRRRACDALARTLWALPTERRAEVLRPLQAERSRETRKLAALIAREFRLPTDPIPSDAPTGRGDEPTP